MGYHSGEFVYNALRVKGCGLAAGSCLLTGGFLAYVFRDFTPWIGWGLAFTLFVLWHFIKMSSRIICFPHLVTLVYLLQHFFAPWYEYCHLSSNVSYRMSVSPDAFFSFSVPCIISLFAGFLFFSMRGQAHSDPWKPRYEEQRFLKRQLDLLMFFGVIFCFLSAPLGLFGNLLADFRYVALFIYMLLKLAGWKWRVGIIFGLDALISLRGGMFHTQMLWGACGYLIYLYGHKGGLRKTVFGLLLALFFLMLILLVKGEYRRQTWYRQDNDKASLTEKSKIFSNLVFQRLQDPRNTMEEGGLDAIFQRLNQGRIVGWILTRVPSEEPFVQGETVFRALWESPFPRFLMPGKLKAGGGEYFERFTGHSMGGKSSANLSVPGEFFVNFGMAGAILAMFFYGFFLSAVLTWLSKKAESNVLWLAWIPYLLMPVMKAEDDFSFVINWFVKAWILMFLSIHIVPFFRKLFLRLKA